jgi:hypothetical protein
MGDALSAAIPAHFRRDDASRCSGKGVDRIGEADVKGTKNDRLGRRNPGIMPALWRNVYAAKCECMYAERHSSLDERSASDYASPCRSRGGTYTRPRGRGRGCLLRTASLSQVAVFQTSCVGRPASSRSERGRRISSRQTVASCQNGRDEYALKTCPGHGAVSPRLQKPRRRWTAAHLPVCAYGGPRTPTPRRP